MIVNKVLMIIKTDRDKQYYDILDNNEGIIGFNELD